MQKIQLYIEGQRVDLFDDESVVLTQTIQNVKDVQKVFTDYSKTFTLPATKGNNKIFKHYYNNSITNGFDGRSRVSATLELNHLKFKKGKIKLEGVDLSDQSGDKVVYTSYTDNQAVKATIQYTGDAGAETSTVKISQLNECKFTPYKTTFINKFGVLQDLYFFKKSVEKMTTKRESYKANTLTSSNTYNTYNHTKRDFNIVANESVSLSSGFVNESYNEVFKQMMLSEKVWITNENNQVYPINIKTSNITYKTSVNDRLVEYTIEFDNSYNVLNDIR